MDLTKTQTTPSTYPLASSREPLPVAWVERLFDRLSATFGASISRVYEGASIDSVKTEWAIALGENRIEPSEIERGIRASHSQRFAPNLAEFMLLCRPALDPAVAWAEGEARQWSHKVVQEVCMEFSYELRTSNFREQRARFSRALSRAWENHRG
jgi:hypothetical protein